MIRTMLLALAVLTAESAWAQPRRILGSRLPRVSWFAGPGSVSVSVGSPYGGFSYHGDFPTYGPYRYGWGYDGYVSPYGTYYNPQSGYVEHFLPPVHFPAELMYGPQAVRRFMGLDRVPPIVPTPPPVVVEKMAAPEALPKPRASNLASRERARHFLSAGDQLFREQKHHDALQRYKSAAQAAPDLAETYFRQGFALVATNRFELAADSFRRGLTLAPDWPESSFRLDELYGEAALAKQAHIDALARAALAAPDDADLMFVLGVFLHFDGQTDRARRFFVRAQELTPGEATHLTGFLAAGP